MGNVKAAQNRQLRSATSSVSVRLFGPFEASIDGHTVRLASKKARALLCYLALREGSEIARSILTGLLWGERSEEQARASLRQTLSETRQLFDGASRQPIEATKETVTWQAGAAWIDARVLEAAASAEDEDVLREAASLFRGDLLEGFSIGEAGFEQWLAGERERFRLLASGIYAKLMQQAEEGGRANEALAHGQKLLSIDPLQEHVHRTLMRLYAAHGRHDAALAQYERCKRELAGQLGVRPEAATEELARELRSSRRSNAPRKDSEPPYVEEPAQTAPRPPAVTDRPSIAVLPFANMSSAPGHEFLADGMTEDIITALSRIRELFVISRNSSFFYKGRVVRAEEVARALGVGFVLEGSVRVAGNRVRVTAQLIDGLSGRHVWAENFDGALDDIFAVQDEITRNIALAMQVELTYGESARLWEGQTKSLRAWEKLALGRGLFFRFNGIDNRRARRAFAEALDIDPNYAAAMVLLAHTYWWEARFDTSADKEHCLELAEQQVQAALRVDRDLSMAHMMSAGIAFLRDQHDEAIRLSQKAVDLSPSDAWARGFLGIVCIFGGESERAVATLKTSMRLSPHHPTWVTYHFALASLWNGDHAAAVEAAERYRELEPNDPFSYTNLAIVYGFHERNDDAAALISELKQRFPQFSRKDMVLSNRYKEQAKLDRVLGVLRKAGLPD
jgi:TolB-like protein/DNA-binding SARP family transcriptional activator